MSVERERHWYEAYATIGTLPPLHRLCGLYCWLFSRLTGGKMRGARAVMVRIAALTRALKLRDTALVHTGSLDMWVDLHDPRILFALDEAMGIGTDNRLLRAILKPGDTFLDVGANHGTYSLNAAQVVGAQGRIIAFEPNPRLAKLVRASFKSNNFAQAEVIETACSDREGKSDFYIPLAWSGEGSLYNNPAHVHCQQAEVRLARMDDVLADTPLPGQVFLKIDVEGSEIAVLRGAQHVISVYRPYIHFEVSPQNMAASDQSVEDILQFLNELGYTQFAEVDAYTQTVSLEHLERTKQRNLLAIP